VLRRVRILMTNNNIRIRFGESLIRILISVLPQIISSEATRPTNFPSDGFRKNRFIDSNFEAPANAQMQSLERKLAWGGVKRTVSL